MEQKTPARGSAFWRPRPVSEAPPPATAHNASPEKLQAVREIAARAAVTIPTGFERVLPRGYTVGGTALIMARFEMIGTRGHALYGRHSHWGEKEANVFLRDIREGWLTELSVFMRWQLRADPIANAIFQHALVHLNDEAMKRLKLL